MRNRKAMDLPTTDPGSDLYDLSDSADETNLLSIGDLKGRSSEDESRLSGKENRRKKKSELELPQIVRPRSVSLGEDIISSDIDRKTKRLRRRPM